MLTIVNKLFIFIKSDFAYKIFNVMVGKILTAVFSFVSFLLLTKYYPLHEIGEYVAFLSLSAIISMIGNWGINEFVFREASLSDNENSRYIALSRKSKVSIGLFALSVSVVVLYILGYSYDVVNIFILITIAALIDAQTISYIVIFRAKGVNQIEMIVFPLRALVKLVMLLLIANIDGSILGVVSSWVVVNILFLRIVVYIYKRKLGNLSLPKVSYNEIYDNLKKSTSYALTGVVSTLYQNSPPILVRVFLGAEAVALYGVAVQVYQALTFIPVSVNIALQPILTRLYASDVNAWKSRLKKIITSTAVISVFIAAASYMIIPSLLVAMFGDKYQESGVLVSYMMIAFFSTFIISSALAPIYISASSSKRYYKVYSVAYILNIVFNYFLINSLGVVGAVLSLVLSELSLVVMLLYVLRVKILKSLYVGAIN